MFSLMMAYVVLFALAGAAGFGLGWLLRRIALRDMEALVEADTAEFRADVAERRP